MLENQKFVNFVRLPWYSNQHQFPTEPFFSCDTIFSMDVSIPVGNNKKKSRQLKNFLVVYLNSAREEEED